ncbi:unnamed protein product, partial [marine sediment metagenome]
INMNKKRDFKHPIKRTEPDNPKYTPPKVAPDFELPIYKKNGFKRKAGAVVGILGGILCFVPHPAAQAIGQGILALGGGTTIVGGLDALKKNREKPKDTYVDNNKFLRIIADIIIRLINQYVKKKGKSK